MKKTAEEILKSKLDTKILIINNADYTFNKIIEAMEEYAAQCQEYNAEQLTQIIEVLTKLKVDSTKPDCKTLRTGDYRIGLDAAISLIQTLNKQ